MKGNDEQRSKKVMAERSHACLIISSFTCDPLAGFLSNDDSPPVLTATTAPFGQVHQVCTDTNHPCWSSNPDTVVVWTQPEAVIPSFRRMLDGTGADAEVVLAEVDRYADMLRSLEQRVRSVFVASWVVPFDERPFDLLAMSPGSGIEHLLQQMNLRLADRLAESESVHVLNAARWMSGTPGPAFNPKSWYMGKIPFALPVFRAAGEDIKAALASLLGLSTKLIILDLDNTLWGGIVGDLGPANIKVGGHDPEGEAFSDFQRGLKMFKERGVLLGIVSKNTEELALEAIRSHPEMVLREEDFVGYRINWNDKAQNIVELVDELNIGLNSVVFIDDNPAERDRVRTALPEVFVPDWPSDVSLYRKTLFSLRCLGRATVSEEDRKRTGDYRAERDRRQLRTSMPSLDEWLSSLDLKVRIAPFDPKHLKRVAQLLNKTNQMNLTTRRMTEGEIREWVEADGHYLWTCRVGDRFGDSGLVGIVSVAMEEGECTIVDFILSCRVMGRRIEDAMLTHAFRFAQQRRCRCVRATHVPTDKNKPCLDFFLGSGMEHDPAAGVFSLATDRERPYPTGLTVES